MDHSTQFAKHQIIFCETFGVCDVAEITNLAPKKGEPILYYKLQSVFNVERSAYTATQILMSEGIKKNPSQTLVHDGFFSSYSVFGYFSVKTGRLSDALCIFL